MAEVKKYLLGGIALAVGLTAMLHPPQPKQAVAIATAPPHKLPHALASAPGYAIVYVAGAVKVPGIYRLAPGSRAFSAVKLAGGFQSNADTAGVNLAEVIADGEEIAVPVQGQRPLRRAAGRPRAKKKRGAKYAPGSKIDLNYAPEAAFAQLPGIGDELAQRIVRFREVNGPFISVDELADVAGMTPRRIETLSPYLYVR